MASSNSWSTSSASTATLSSIVPSTLSVSASCFTSTIAPSSSSANSSSSTSWRSLSSTIESTTSSKVQSTTSSRASSKSPTSTTSTSSPSATTTSDPPGSLVCPDANGTTYEARTGARYVVECYYGRFNSDIKYVYTFGLDKCIEAYEQTEACVDVSYVPGSAYDNGICCLKSAAQWGLLKMDVWGARKLPSPSCPDSNGMMYTLACGAEYALNATLIERAGTSRRVLRLRM